MKSNAASRAMSIATSALTGPIGGRFYAQRAPLQAGGRGAVPNRTAMEEFTRCTVCTRTPLVGEQMTVMSAGRRESAVCDLCLERPRAETLGTAVRRERIRSTPGAANVRRAWAVPAPKPAQPVAAG
jgi:hypothetical protein